MTQSGFVTPFNSDDDGNGSGPGSMTIMAYGTMVLAFLLTVIAALTKRKKALS